MSVSVSQMSDLSKMMLFMFLGLVIAILVLGFSRSPKASPSLGVSEVNLPAGSRTEAPSKKTVKTRSMY